MDILELQKLQMQKELELAELDQLIKEAVMKPENWMHADSYKIYGDASDSHDDFIEIGANYATWNITKEKMKEDSIKEILHIDGHGQFHELNLVLTVDETVKLYKQLKKIVEYLEVG